MTVFLVGAGPGDPGLLTRRAAELLAQADVVLYDRLVHPSILALAPASAQLIDVGKSPGGAVGGRTRQDEIDRLLVAHGRRSHTVVRLKGGDPFLFGRGGEEVNVLARAGVPWEVIPGVPSAFAVPAAVGIPVTHRGLSSSVTVVTGRVDDPIDGVDWGALAKIDGTLVILMGMMDRAEIAEALQRGGKAGSTPTAVIERGTTPDQAVVRTTLDQLAAVPLESPAVIVVGPVAALGADALDAAFGSADTPLSGRTVVVSRSGPRARDLLDLLHRAGAETISVSLTEQADPADGGAGLRTVAKRAGDFRWVVFTSVNAVTRFMAEMRDARAFGAALVAAVGPATADALRRAGVEPDLVPADYRALGLVAEFPNFEADSRSNLVLFPSAAQAPMTISDGLSAKGWSVQRVDTYRTVSVPPPPPAVVAQMAAADVVIFTATSTVESYVALEDPDGSSLRVPPVVICIGPTTAASARECGMTGVVEAGDATAQGIFDAVVRHLTQSDVGASGATNPLH